MEQPEKLPDYESAGGYTLYTGALSCMRHRGEEFYELQQKGRLSYLILSDIDFVTGDYLSKIKQAATELSEEFRPEFLNIAAGCPGTLLSTDYDMLSDELEAELGIPVKIDKNCHLMGFDGHNKGQGHGGHGEHGRGHGAHHSHREYPRKGRAHG